MVASPLSAGYLGLVNFIWQDKQIIKQTKIKCAYVLRLTEKNFFFEKVCLPCEMVIIINNKLFKRPLSIITQIIEHRIPLPTLETMYVVPDFFENVNP